MCLYSLLELQGRAGHSEGIQVPAGENCSRAAVGSIRDGVELNCPAGAGIEMGGAQGVLWGLVRVWTLGQFSFEAGHSLACPTGMVSACVYVVSWGYREGMAMVEGVGGVQVCESWRDRVQWVAGWDTTWRQLPHLLVDLWGLQCYHF